MHIWHGWYAIGLSAAVIAAFVVDYIFADRVLTGDHAPLGGMDCDHFDNI